MSQARIDYTPRDYQRPFLNYMLRNHRGGRAVWSCHRRAGKDLTAIAGTVALAMHKRVGGWWHVYPTYKQARRAIWDGFRADGKRILSLLFPNEIIKRKNEQEMTIELVSGSIWRLIGSDNIDSIVGAGPVGVIFSEFAICKPNAWEYVRPMLVETEGFAAFISTPRGKNHFWEQLEIAKKRPGWFWEVLPHWKTKVLPPDVVETEIASGMSRAKALQEYGCDFEVANEGSIWGEQAEALEKSGRVTEFEHRRDQVFTSWDLGRSDSTSIWFWRVSDDGLGLDIIDFFENHGKPLSFYFNVLEERGYSYQRHWLPHDAKQKTVASELSVRDQFNNEYPGAVSLGPSLSVQDGIQAARWLLQQPRLRIHSRCKVGFEAIKAYHRIYDEERKVYSDEPEHDWSSHAADSFRYLSCVSKYVLRLMKKEAPPPPPRVRAVHEFSLEELWDTAPRRVSGGRI